MKKSKTEDLTTEQVKNMPESEIFFDGVAEVLLAEIPLETRIKLGTNWSNRTARISDNATTYRFINYLTETNLLDDSREISGKGWRRFSYVECVYLELVLSLRKLGVQSNTIRHLHKIFSAPFTEELAGHARLDWLDILIAVHFGIEVEVLIDNDDETPLICDPEMAEIFGLGATEGQIRVSLSAIVNNVRQRSGMKPIEVRHHFGVHKSFDSRNLNLEDDEYEAVMALRSADKRETVRMKKQERGTLFERVRERKDEIDGALEKQLSSLVGEGFGSVHAKFEGGKVVSLETTAKKVIPKK